MRLVVFASLNNKMLATWAIASTCMTPGMTGEMTLEKWLVDRDSLHARAFGFRVETDDAIDHKKRETMRQNLHHLIGIESAVAAWNRARYGHGASTRLFACN